MEKLRSKALQVVEHQPNESVDGVPFHEVILSSGSIVRGVYASDSMPEVPTIGLILYTDNQSIADSFIKKFSTSSMKTTIEQDNLTVVSKHGIHERMLVSTPLRNGTRKLAWGGVWALQFIQHYAGRMATRILHCDNKTGEILADSGVKHVNVFDAFTNITYNSKTVH